MTLNEQEKYLNLIKEWDFKEAKLLTFGIINDITKDNAKAIDKGQSIYITCNEIVGKEMMARDEFMDPNIKFKDQINNIINWYPNLREKAINASIKVGTIKDKNKKKEYYLDVLRYSSMTLLVQLTSISALIEDTIFEKHKDLPIEVVMSNVMETAKVLQAFYLKFMYQFDKDISVGSEVNETVAKYYKDEAKYKIILDSMLEIGLISIIPRDILDKSLELAKNGNRERSLEILKRNEEKKVLVN